jgi:hypothetical protein
MLRLFDLSSIRFSVTPGCSRLDVLIRKPRIVVTLFASLAGCAGPETVASRGTNPDQSRIGGTAVYSVDGMSGFTTENVMKVHQGMGSNKILEMFGTPESVSQSVCGGSVGRPWNCTTWEYRGEFPYYYRASFTFSGNSGSLVLNNFDVHKK